MSKLSRNKIHKDTIEGLTLNQHFRNKEAAKKLKDAETANVDLVIPLLKFQDSFIRDVTQYKLKTKSKDEVKQKIELARYAFGKYPVCPVLTNVWKINQSTPLTYNQQQHRLHLINSIDFRTWYICVASGGSLYKTHAKELLTKKEVHNLVTCKHDLDISQGLIYAVAKGSGASEGICLRVAKTKLKDKPFDEFWRTVIRFFASHETKSINQINDLIDYIDNEHRQPDSIFEMAGKTIEILEKKTKDWHYALRRIKVMGNSSWNGVFIPDEEYKTTTEHGEVIWRMSQIKTSKDLAAEGNELHHCVYSYQRGCLENRLSIWSLQKQNPNGVFKRRITIELNSSGYIVQARGLANRAMKPDETSAVQKWVSSNGLRISL